MLPNPMYEVSVGLTHDDEDGRVEMGLSVVIEVEGDDPKGKRAIAAAVRWALDRKRQLAKVLNNPEVGAIKVHAWRPVKVDEKGRAESNRGLFPLYEWKCDWGRPMGE